jgi:hypothetical protein
MISILLALYTAWGFKLREIVGFVLAQLELETFE